MPGIDNEDLEATGFEDFEGGDPVDAGGFHRDRVDLCRLEPICEGVQVSGKGGKRAHTFSGVRKAQRAAAKRRNIAKWGDR